MTITITSIIIMRGEKRLSIRNKYACVFYNPAKSSGRGRGASNTPVLNVSLEARTSGILFKPMKEQNQRLTIG